MNLEGVLLRPMTRKDLDRVAQLETGIFPDPWSRKAFEHEVLAGSISWPRVAEDATSGVILAYMVAWFAADEVHLANLAVAPAARRRGLAQAMLDSLIAEGRRRRARMVLLEVRRSNAAAKRLYRKNGFYTLMVRGEYYRDNKEDALVMIKPLDESGVLRIRKDLSR